MGPSMDKILHPPSRPTSLSEVLQLLNRYPDSIILAGGTHSFSLQPQMRSTQFPHPLVISLDRVEELHRVSRTERYLEFGAVVPLQRITQLSTHILPKPLRSCLKSIGTPSLRRLATIGGNLMVPESSIGLGIVTSLLEGTAEIRRAGGVRRIPVARLISEERTLQAGELLTRIRIPNKFPSHAVYSSFGSPYDRSSHPLGVCGLAYIEKSSIEGFHFVTATIPGNIARNRELEADIIGQRIPVPQKDLQALTERWKETLVDQNFSAIQIERNARIFLHFLSTFAS